MNLPRILSLLAAFALGFLCLRACSLRREQTPLVRIEVQKAYPLRPASELEGLPPTTDRDRACLSVSSDVENPERKTDPLSTMTVKVRDAVTQTPVPGLATTSRLFLKATGNAEPPIEGSTDARGELSVGLESAPELVQVQLRSPITNALLASWSGRPQPALDLDVPSLQFAFGQLRTREDLGPATIALLRVTVHAHTPAGDIFLGDGPIARDGRFQIPVHPSPEQSELVLDLANEGRHIARLIAPLDMATDPPGVIFALDLSRLELHVKTRAGVPVARAAIGIEVDLGRDLVGAVLLAETDEAGGCSLVLPNGRGRMCVWSDGYDALVEDLVLPSPALGLVLDPVDSLRRIDVETMTSSGEPIAGAIVSLRPTESPELGSAALVQTRTDTRGRASLNCPLGGHSTLVAFHPDHGMAGPLRVDAVAGAHFILIMEDVSDLRIELQVSAADMRLARGRIAWCAVDLARKRSWSETWSGPPHTLQFLPRGDLLVFVCFLETGLFGMERVTITAEPGQTLTVPVREGFSLAGRILSKNRDALNGLEVALDVPGILPDIADRFCRCRVQASGRFQVFAGDAISAGIRVLRNGTALWSATGEVAGEHLIQPTW